MSKFITHLPLDGEFKVTWKYGATWNGAGTSDNKHHGIDLIGSDEIYSTCEGKVEYAGFDKGGFGNYVKIVDNSGLSHYFAHLAEIKVNVGQKVTYTTLVGIMGATGNVTGKHLHYEIRQNGIHIDPTSYMKIPNKEGTYNYLDYKIEIVDKPKTQTVTLPASVQSWRVYPLDKQPIIINACGELLPAKKGGLTYDILEWAQKDVAIIKTRDFGKVQIYVGPDTSAIIK